MTNVMPFPRPPVGGVAREAHRVSCQSEGCAEHFLTEDRRRAEFMAGRWLCGWHDGSGRPPAPMITAIADQQIAAKRIAYEANETERRNQIDRQENQ